MKEHVLNCLLTLFGFSSMFYDCFIVAKEIMTHQDGRTVLVVLLITTIIQTWFAVHWYRNSLKSYYKLKESKNPRVA